ncbi:MAG TPA: non-ribosomal peptide synthetase [Pseudonocardiaceae bacterium]
MTHDAASGTLVELFARSVRQYSDRPAVSDDTRTMTYAQLDRESDAIAALLSGLGVGAEDRVGLYVNRSAGLVAAVLGVLKTGAAYLAVDARYPDARRDYMLGNGAVKVVVTEPGWTSRLAGLSSRIVSLGQLADATSPVSRPNPRDAASVLFTSGSSGEPKAIVLEHRNLVSLAYNPDLPALRPADRTGQISSVSFDAFHLELWPTLAAGAECVVLPPVPELLAADFQRQLTKYAITSMIVPTMVVNHVVQEDPDAFVALRILQVGGDVLLPSACRALLGGRFAGRLFNLYGPAEITTACTLHEVTGQDAESDTIPIGRALAGTSLWVLDQDRGPVAVGETGELFIAGPGVARGYLDRPDLTDERFVTLPDSDGAVRAYRTGDLVRQRADGTFLFVGRADNQVKIRGYRVEPGEVERGLLRHAEVTDAVVLPHGTGNDRRLVAFVVVDDGLGTAELRARAQRDLPDFMVPSQFVVLPRIPATEHGKRDTAALYELLAAQREREDAYVAPETDTERYLATLWAELLNTERVGRDEDFFGLGGHSLLAFRMHHRVNRELGTSLTFPVVLNNTVLRDLASVLDTKLRQAA